MNKTVTNPLGLALFAGVGLAAYRYWGGVLRKLLPSAK